MSSRLTLRTLRRGLCSAGEGDFAKTLRQRMRQKLDAVTKSPAAADGPAPAPITSFKRPKREGPQRRMVDHRLPPYVEASFKSLTFMLVCAPRFLKEWPWGGFLGQIEKVPGASKKFENV